MLDNALRRSAGRVVTALATSTVMRSAKRKTRVHVVLDQYHRHLMRQARDGLEELMAV